jgi:hypothetical protein
MLAFGMGIAAQSVLFESMIPLSPRTVLFIVTVLLHFRHYALRQ